MTARIALGDTVQLRDAYGDGTRGTVTGRTLDGRFVDVELTNGARLVGVAAQSVVRV